MKTFYIKTLGCKVNQYEGQAIRERFEQLGMKEVGLEAWANFCVVNICTVTETADRKSRNAIRKAIRKNKNSKIVITGCMSKSDAQKLGDKIKGINYIIPKSFFADGVSAHCGHTRAFLKIQDGCNLGCSFCKVSLVRGRSRSRPVSAVLEETRRVVESGFKEIVLTGVCLGSFGFDLGSGDNLVSLIEKLEEVEALKRIRLSSIEPRLISRQLIDLLGSSSKLCPHLHIPLQSGDNKILKAMARDYKLEDYLSIVERIKEKVADIAITTDVLVGFPGEDEQSFKNTLRALKSIMPLRVHRFLYSPREGTVAAKERCLMPSKTDSGRRMEELKSITDELSLKFRNLFKYKELDVLVEECNNGWLSGYSGNYIRVNFPGSPEALKKILTVKIDKATKTNTKGLFVCRREAEERRLDCCHFKG